MIIQKHLQEIVSFRQTDKDKEPKKKLVLSHNLKQYTKKNVVTYISTLKKNTPRTIILHDETKKFITGSERRDLT